MKPKIFVGSSIEALEVAYAIQENLEYDANVTIWNQGVFELSSNTLDDLIKALNNFDFGIFVFKPDDISNIRSSEMNIVRDNVIFELGLFIGKLGKEKVFFVIPRDIKNFHLPTDLLGVMAGQYESNRGDGNLKAALGIFCNQVRQKLKKHTYENLNDLVNESVEAKRIAIEKPYGWEYLLSAELLASRLININQSYDELEKGLVFSRTKRYTDEEFQDWFLSSVSDLQKFAAIFKVLFEELNESYGPPGVPGKILDIKLATDKFISLSKELLAWEYRIQEAEPPEGLNGVKNIMNGWSKNLFNGINKIPPEIKRVIEASKNPNTEKDDLSINIALEPLPDVYKAVELYKEYFLGN